MPAWEQSYLRLIVFGDNPQSSFAAVGFGAFNGAVKPYSDSSDLRKVPAEYSSSNSATGVVTPTSSIDSYLSFNSLQCGVAGLRGLSHLAEVKSAEANYGEGSGPNKRPHVEEERPSEPPRPLSYQIPGPQKIQQPPTLNPGLPPSQNQGPSQAMFPFQPVEDRAKQKGKKRVGKRAQPQPLVGLMNNQGFYDSPASVRNILQSTKINMT